MGSYRGGGDFGGGMRGFRSPGDRGDSGRQFGDRQGMGNRHNFDNRHRGDGDHGFRRVWRNGRWVFIPVGVGWYDDGYYYYGYGGCESLRRRAVATGEGYWWSRYEACIEQ